MVNSENARRDSADEYWEHTRAVTEDGPRVLTARPARSAGWLSRFRLAAEA